ncbi:hypothetical protein JVU11DRAFT_8456 [Chiua virens]|nr:hypothetical protein JVU11DRAFT_8456 [Chiua virens]
MSPIPSSIDAFALLPTPAVVDNSGQPPPAQSQVLLGTGGLLVAVVAIVSIAAYFSRKRGTAKGSAKSRSWAPGWNGLFSTLGRRGSDTACNGATDCRAPVDIDVGVEHVSMVYARHFHPTGWSPVESHPPTSSAPAIYVEEEAQEPQVSEPKPFGMNSFLDVGDDEGDDSDDSIKRAPEGHRQVERPGFRRPPPYDTSTSINVSFTIDAIGTTTRKGAFLSVPGEPDEELSNEETSDSRTGFLQLASL